MKRVLKFISFVIIIFLILFAALLVFLSVTEYKPKEIEDVAISGSSKDTLSLDEDYKLLTWNIGYAGLDKDTDFFMDGGKMVNPISKDHVLNALDGIEKSIQNIDPDLLLLQEVDSNSSRTYNINEVEFFDSRLVGASTFAYNYKVAFVPFPIPPMGKVSSGIYTKSKFKIDSSYRYKQPNPHKWPTKLANLKRGFNVSYLPIKDTDKELVLINVHLDAYESGSEGRIAQSKQILAFMAEEYKKGNYVIVGGDFNQELRKNHEANIPDGMWNPSIFPYQFVTDSFDVLFDDKVTTSRLNDKPYDPATAYEYIIDGYIVSKNVKVKKVQGQDLGYIDSDHNPVLLEFSLEENAE